MPEEGERTHREARAQRPLPPRWLLRRTGGAWVVECGGGGGDEGAVEGGCCALYPIIRTSRYSNEGKRVFPHANAHARVQADVMKAFKRAEGLSRPSLTELFNDVYAGQEPWTIVSADLSLIIFFLYLSGFLHRPVLLTIRTERTTERALRSTQEIRSGLGPLEKGVGQVQERRAGLDRRGEVDWRAQIGCFSLSPSLGVSLPSRF